MIGLVVLFDSQSWKLRYLYGSDTSARSIFNLCTVCIEVALEYLQVRLFFIFRSSSLNTGHLLVPAWWAAFCMPWCSTHNEHLAGYTFCDFMFLLSTFNPQFWLVYFASTLVSKMFKVPTFIALDWSSQGSYSAIDTTNYDFAIFATYLLRYWGC